MKMQSLLVLNGPGLEALGERDSSFDTSLTLERIEEECAMLCGSYGIAMTFKRGDVVGELIDCVARGADGFDALIISPIGHCSHEAHERFEQFRSAMKMLARLKKPVIEVHLTNIFHDGASLVEPLREPEAQIGFVSGLGLNSYLLAIKAIAERAGAKSAQVGSACS